MRQSVCKILLVSETVDYFVHSSMLNSVTCILFTLLLHELPHDLQAIEAGRLPGDILDEIPSKYYNGSVVCEVSCSITFMKWYACNAIHFAESEF
jgi:hypothetical protein